MAIFDKKKKKSSKSKEPKAQSSEAASTDKPESEEEIESTLSEEGEEKIKELTTEVTSGSGMMSEAMIADVEKLKAQAEASNELRTFFSEKFSRIDEEIGELRNQIIDGQKDVQQIEVKATKASDLVAEVHPEALMVDLKKSDSKVEALTAKLEANEEINSSIIEELKEIRNSLRTFRGVEELKKMNAEIMEDQAVVKKIEGNIEQHSDKVESIFLEINKKYEEFRRFNEKAENMKDAYARATSEYQDYKVKFESLASKGEFDDFRKEIRGIVIPVSQDEKKFSDIISKFKKLEVRMVPLLDKYEAFDLEVKKTQRDIMQYKNELKAKFDQRMKNYESLVLRIDREKEDVKGTNGAEIKQIKAALKKLLVFVEEENPRYFINKLKQHDKEINQMKAAVTKLAKMIKGLIAEIKKKQV
ncbi:hypothetical protein GOV08_00860 [Candidatus Woesearchaeota archaeon]|nr:hypothetical protein [Candidatus Woesearchaeota archaeon]